MTDLPIASTPSQDTLQTRRNRLLAQLLQRAKHQQLTEHGLSVRFSPSAETIAMLARVVVAERQCCRLLRFVITVEPDGGPVSLELSGPAGTRVPRGFAEPLTIKVPAEQSMLVSARKECRPLGDPLMQRLY